MKKSTYNSFVLYQRFDNGITLLVVYVDEIVITENDVSGISPLKTFFHGQFHTKD